MQKVFKATQGVGLVEVLIALLILSGCVVSVLKFQSALSYNQASAEQKIEASFLAEQKLNTFRDFQVLNPQSPYFSYSEIVSGTSTVTGFNSNFTLTWTVTTYTSYKKIDITVSWVDRYNISNSVRLVTNIAKYDPTADAYSIGI